MMDIDTATLAITVGGIGLCFVALWRHAAAMTRALERLTDQIEAMTSRSAAQGSSATWADRQREMERQMREADRVDDARIERAQRERAVTPAELPRARIVGPHDR